MDKVELGLMVYTLSSVHDEFLLLSNTIRASQWISPGFSTRVGLGYNNLLGILKFSRDALNADLVSGFFQLQCKGIAAHSVVVSPNRLCINPKSQIDNKKC